MVVPGRYPKVSTVFVGYPGSVFYGTIIDYVMTVCCGVIFNDASGTNGLYRTPNPNAHPNLNPSLLAR